MEPPAEEMIKKVRQYYLLDLLGKGSFGHVYRSRVEHCPEQFAIKQIPRSKAQKDQSYLKALEEEIITLKSISHPHIVRFVELLITKNNYYLVTELCNQGSLKDYLKARPPAPCPDLEALRLMAQIRDGFEELRAHEVTHNDFKAENVFVHNNVVKIGDFGSAVYRHGKQGLLSGSIFIQAPELLYSDLFHGRTDLTDLWSIGCVFYYILFRQHPYPIDSVAALYQALTADEFVVSFPCPVTEEMRDLITRLLQRQPDQRINWADFFAHPVFDGLGTKRAKPHPKPHPKSGPKPAHPKPSGLTPAVSTWEKKDDSMGFIHID